MIASAQELRIEKEKEVLDNFDMGSKPFSIDNINEATQKQFIY